MDKVVSCNHVQLAMRVLLLFVCFGGKVTGMDMVGQIILLAMDKVSQITFSNGSH